MHYKKQTSSLYICIYSVEKTHNKIIIICNVLTTYAEPNQTVSDDTNDSNNNKIKLNTLVL